MFSLFRIIQFLKDKWRGNLGGLRSPDWRVIRNSYLARNPYCEVCGTTKSLNCHHCLPFHIRPDLELNYDNLITLCSDHHFLFGHLMNWKSFNPAVKQDTAFWQDKIKKRP